MLTEAGEVLCRHVILEPDPLHAPLVPRPIQHGADTMSGALGILTEPDVRVPMRDGARMGAHVFRPDAGGPFPAILHRTPYGRRRDGYERYVRAGYAVVSMDSRGRYGSEGDWVPFTVERTGDAEDGYDSVEWLAAQPWCDGRVGTLGASYDAWMQWQLARLRPPHLAAMCAYTIPLELTDVDWPGAFRPGRRIKWWLTSMAPDLRRRRGLPPPHRPAEARQDWSEADGENPWTEYLPWLDFPRHLPPGLAEYARDWLEHPNRRPWRFDEVQGRWRCRTSTSAAGTTTATDPCGTCSSCSAAAAARGRGPRRSWWPAPGTTRASAAAPWPASTSDRRPGSTCPT